MNLQRIKNIAELRRIEFKNLAVEVGMSEGNLHRCVRENKIQAGVLEKIARKLNVSICEFFDDTPGSVHTEGVNSTASFYGNAQVMTENTKYLESLLEEKDKRILLLETILKNNNLL